MTAQETNQTDFAAIGRQAAEDYKQGARANGRGDARATYALFLAYNTAIFTATITAKGQPDETFDFTLDEYMNTEPKANANGTRNIKAVAARTNAVASRVFGVDKPDNAFKQNMRRALDVVAYFIREGFDETNVSLNKRGELVVPYVAMHDEPKEDASEKEVKLYRAMEGETVNLDGKDGDSFAQLLKRAKPKAERQAATDTPDKGASLMASALFVKETIGKIMSEDAPDDMPAPNNDMRRELHALMTTLQGYFTADPVEEKKQGKKAA